MQQSPPQPEQFPAEGWNCWKKLWTRHWGVGLKNFVEHHRGAQGVETLRWLGKGCGLTPPPCALQLFAIIVVCYCCYYCCYFIPLLAWRCFLSLALSRVFVEAAGAWKNSVCLLRRPHVLHCVPPPSSHWGFLQQWTKKTTKNHLRNPSLADSPTEGSDDTLGLHKRP